MTTARDQLLLDIFNTALEGGIGYWSQCSEYHWWKVEGDYDGPDVKGFYATIHDEDEDTFRIDRTVVAKGLNLAATEWRDKLYWSSDKPPLVVTDDTDWDYDAGDADMIVQLGLFGDVVYG
jgi:hypothetical protein